MILIVDDKQENLFSLKTLLQLNLYEVDTATSGEEALLKILKKEYALIILDVQMPGMDGFEVAETITGYSKTRDIPIIFLSAVNIDKRFITKGYESGGVDYITKPFDPDLLLLKVRTFYKLYEQTRELKSVQRALKEEIENRRKAQEAIEQMNLLLEEKVRDRTEELLQLNKDLEIRNVELAQFASLASHDLQEPLRKIITFGHIIDEKYLCHMGEAAELMKKINASSERMRNLINDLLNYSKLSAETFFSEVDLNAVIHETMEALELSIEEKQATIVCDEMPKVEAIPGQMRQLFQNLISNALKFSKSGLPPVVRIWAEFVSERSLTALPSTGTGDYVRIFVEDNGIGFNEIYLTKIFSIFQRLHSRSEYEGTGIGLAIVKKIIEKHKGLISARSKDGEGTTFIMVLPVRETESYVPAE